MSRFLDPVRLGGGIKIDRRNLIPNPSFEVDTSGWVLGPPGSTLTRSTAWSASGAGSASMLLTRIDSSGPYTQAIQQPTGGIPITPGATYTLSATARMAPGGAASSSTVRVGLYWYDSVRVKIGATQVGPYFTVTNSTDTRVSATFTAPANAVWTNVWISQDTAAANDAYYVDAFMLEQASSVQPYFDGGVSGYRWTGIPHNSISESMLDLGASTITNVAGILPSGATFGLPAGVAFAPRRVNLIPNPSFEVDTAGWFAMANSTINTSATWAKVGSKSLAVTCTTAGTVGAVCGDNLTAVPVTAGQTYSASCAVRTGVAGRQMRLQADWVNDVGVFASSTGPIVIVAANVDTNLTATWQAPVGAIKVRLSTTTFSAAISDVYYFDNFLLEQAGVVGPYFDGNTPGYRWTGVAHNSTSESALDLTGNPLTNVAGISPSGATFGLPASVALAPRRVNLIPNPSVEVDTAGWATDYATFTIARSTAWFKTGTASALMKQTAVSGDIDTYAQSAVGAVTPGLPYTFQFVARMAPGGATSRTVRPFIMFTDSTNKTTSFTGSYVTVDDNPQGTKVTFTVTSTPGATRVYGGFNSASFVQNDAIYVDAFLIEQSSTAGPYFDGDQPGYRWTGNAHSSTSESALDLGGASITDLGTLPTGVALASNRRTNLIPNPSFEVDTAGWFVLANSTISTSATWKKVGSKSLAVTCTTAGTVGALYGDNLTAIPVTAGQTYSASCVTFTGIAGRQMRLQADWINDAGTYITTTFGPIVIVAANVDTALTGTWQVPVGATKVKLYTSVFSAVVNDVYYFDTFMLEKSTTVGTYFDGNTPGYRWTGVAHNSTSEGALDMNSQPLVNLPAPVNTNDAVPKYYVDNITTVICTSTTRPLNGKIGQRLFETDTKISRIWDHVAGIWRMDSPYRVTKLVSVASPQVDFIGIPTTLKDIRITGKSRGDTAAPYADWKFRINNDAATQYRAAWYWEQNGAGPLVAGHSLNLGVGRAGAHPCANSEAGLWGSVHLQFTGWGSAFMSCQSVSGYIDANSDIMTSNLTHYAPGGPHTQINLLANVGNFVPGTEFTLIGWE